MEIVTLDFESSLTLTITGNTITLTPFKMEEQHSNIKIGINAPKSITVVREEIKHQRNNRN